MNQHHVVRDARGRWITPPKSPGRPALPTRSERLRAALEPHEKDLVDRLIGLSKGDDPHAAARAIELALRYIAAPAKPEGQAIVIDGLATAATLRDKAACVVVAVASGQITPEAGEKVLRMLDVLGRAAKLDDFESRIAALEGRRVDAIEPPSADASDLV